MAIHLAHSDHYDILYGSANMIKIHRVGSKDELFKGAVKWSSNKLKSASWITSAIWSDAKRHAWPW